MTIAVEHATAPGVAHLLELSDAFHAALYPPEGNFLLDVAELSAPGVTVVVARDDEGTAIGMGTIVEAPSHTEIKRMFVLPEARGTGTAAAILDRLVEVALAHGVRELLLETGPEQPAAIAFYERHGFRRIPLFGQYVGGASSVCMGRTLEA